MKTMQPRDALVTFIAAPQRQKVLGRDYYNVNVNNVFLTLGQLYVYRDYDVFSDLERGTNNCIWSTTSDRGHLNCDLKWLHAVTQGIIIFPMMQQHSILEIHIHWSYDYVEVKGDNPRWRISKKIYTWDSIGRNISALI